MKRAAKKQEDTQRLTVIVPSTMITALKKAAERQRRPYSSIVREALEEYLGIPDTVKTGGGKARESKKDDPQQVAEAVV
jgi:hypothetical protein